MFVDPLDEAMILFKDIVYSQRTRQIGSAFINDNLVGNTIACDGFPEETPRSAEISGTVKLSLAQYYVMIVEHDRTSFFTLSPPSLSAEIFAEAVWLYFRFPLSFRMVEDMLAYRGIFVTYKAVYEWAEKFGRAYANTIRRRSPRLGDKWHLDECVISIKGQHHILW